MDTTFGAIFLTAFVTGLSGAAAPGPLLTWVVSDSARSGPWSGPRTVLGHAAVEFPLVLAIAFGLGAVFQDQRILGWISAAGALVLFWMGYLTLRGVPSLRAPLDERGAASSGRGPFVAGALLSLGNPYWVLWWATIGAGLIGRSLELGAAGIPVFFAGHISADFGWYSLISLAVGRGARFLSKRAYQALMIFLGVALLVLGLTFAFSGYGQLVGQ